MIGYPLEEQLRLLLLSVLERLEDLGGALLDSADGETWLRVLHAMAGEP